MFKTESFQVIPFDIVKASSEDASFPASNLVHLKSSAGWRTAANVPHPHHLIIQPKDQGFVNTTESSSGSNAPTPINVERRVSKIQLLIQEASFHLKVEIFTASAHSNTLGKDADGDGIPMNMDTSTRTQSSHKMNLNFKYLGSAVLSACTRPHIEGGSDDKTTFKSSTKMLSISLENVSASFIKVIICDSSPTSRTSTNTSTSSMSTHNQVDILSLSLFAHHSASCNDQLKKGSDQGVEGFNSRLEALDILKREKAKNEEFETAAKIKEALTNLHKLISTIRETQDAMQLAAEEEDYLTASKLKAKRNYSQATLLRTFDMAEQATEKVLENEITKGLNSNFTQHLDDLSLSIIRRDQDDPSVMTATTSRQFLNDRSVLPREDVIDLPILPRDDVVDIPIFDDGSTMVETTHGPDETLISRRIEEHEPHPLEGVQGFEDLPIPEEIDRIDGDVSTSFNQNTSHTSTDSINKMEIILGKYCTRCLLSKNWSLREAALLKLCQHLKKIISNLQSSLSHWWESFSRGVCIILERAIDDRIVQVVLTGLILLDDCMIEFESINAAPKEVSSLIGNVIIKLVSKLGDSNPKVVEGSQTALMSIALSKLIGPMHIGSQVMKLMSVTDSKAIKSVTKRCEFLKELLEEFGPAAPSAKKHLEFIQSFCLGHKDVEAREATRDLSVALFLRDGNEALSILSLLSDRQAKEYKLAFINAKRGEKLIEERQNSQNFSMVQKLSSEVGSEEVKTPGRRGRGRGRGRSRRVTNQRFGD